MFRLLLNPKLQFGIINLISILLRIPKDLEHPKNGIFLNKKYVELKNIILIERLKIRHFSQKKSKINVIFVKKK